MILADSSVWIDFFRGGNSAMVQLLTRKQIAVHPFVTAELALGSLQNRQQTLADLDEMPLAETANLDEVRSLIEIHSLYSKGIGLVDAYLIASCLITPGMSLWTRDVRLARTAAELGIHTYHPRAQQPQ